MTPPVCVASAIGGASVVLAVAVRESFRFAHRLLFDNAEALDRPQIVNRPEGTPPAPEGFDGDARMSDVHKWCPLCCRKTPHWEWVRKGDLTVTVASMCICCVGNPNNFDDPARLGEAAEKAGGR